MSIFEALEKYHYEAKSGLKYANQFTFLVAILLSAQARDDFINTQTGEFFQIASNAERMYALGVDGIAHYIHRIGLWRNKAKNIWNLSRKIIEFQKIYQSEKAREWYDQFSDEKYENDDLKIYSFNDDPLSDEGLPTFRAGLLELPGIGRKSANVFLNVMYKAPTFPVDTHVSRLTHRLNLANGSPEAIEQILKDIVPENYASVICHWLVWHGRRVCFARNPNCENCLLKEFCSYYEQKNSQER